jgi:hypothetical protein
MRRKIMNLAGISLLAFGSLSSPAKAAVSVGVSAGSQGLNSFYLDIGNYYQVPQAQVEIVRQRHLPDDEAPVAFYLAQQARVAPEVIVTERLSGRSWMSIALGFHLNAANFYYALDEEPGGPYAATYARFRGNRNRWNRIRLRDDEIINLVNLRFATQHYGYRPQELSTFRAGGRHYYEMSRRGDERGNGQGQGQGQGKPKKRGHGNGRGNGKGHGQGEGESNGHGPGQNR